MGIRFRKSFKVAPGVKVNLGKKGASVSMGTKGAHVTMNTHGKTTVSAGIPGSGISYSKSIGGSSHKASGGKASSRKLSGGGSHSSGNSGDPKKPWYTKTGWIIALLILFFPVGLFLAWKYSNWKTGGKVAATIFVAIMVIYALGGGGDDAGETASTVAVIQESTESTTIATEPTASEEETAQSVTTETTPEESPASATQPLETEAPETETPETEAPTEQETEEVTETATEDPIVYITPTGEKYHRSSCRTLKDSVIERHLSEVRGEYEPCKVCNPPQ